MERVHVGKMRAWLHERESLQDLLLWVAVAQPVLHLHFRLFNNASLHGEKPSGRSVWAFSHLGALPARMVQDYATAFNPADVSYGLIWALPIAMMGDLWTWGPSLLTKAFTALNLTMGNVWRRFKVKLAAYPLKLTELVHPSIPLQERRAAAVSFLDASRCCLDDDFSLKLRAHFRTPEDILENPMAVQFLCTTLEGLVGSTSHIEDAFAHMRRHVQAAWRAPSMASLASRSVDIHWGGGGKY